MAKKDRNVPGDAIALCAMEAALATEGVASMAEAAISYDISQLLTGTSKGIRVAQDREKIRVDVYLNALYGHKIPQIAWDVQENVKREVEELTGRSVEAVNIHVQGVSFKDTE
ncbi:MAG: Asp23/Gls24 family envelope stress response protein [Firmicutes bacterium]|jgi:uncharacterized alkaline shock family protein YloU|nr:Asp23/Gls24 family envelope stress response protein [Bacillota bacterium]MBQ2058254.1 Asp23/Gls24 family envelope stress response protein [Bacillota bacterium]MBQ4371594.1 Asp23/Gls24 family envelope stress response protein [Bacillota bacterium]